MQIGATRSSCPSEPADDGGVGFAPEAIDVFEAGALEQTELLRETGRGAVHLRRPAACLHLQLAVQVPQCRRSEVDPLDVQKNPAGPEQLMNLGVDRANELELS